MLNSNRIQTAAAGLQDVVCLLFFSKKKREESVKRGSSSSAIRLFKGGPGWALGLTGTNGPTVRIDAGPRRRLPFPDSALARCSYSLAVPSLSFG